MKLILGDYVGITQRGGISKLWLHLQSMLENTNKSILIKKTYIVFCNVKSNMFSYFITYTIEAHMHDYYTTKDLSNIVKL